ncbi:efflux transporter outer membrane subunit [Burkholderia cepacia]|uniref:efflux transporter outer membrane subunit n=1 Tax=Burkholderia cepacia TaxID=292 RepID=UPI002FE27731
MCLFHPLPFARRVVALGIAAALTACSTLPAYSPPTVAVPAHYAGVPATGIPASGVPATGVPASGVPASAAPVSQPGWNVATPADAASRGPWWTVFDDAALNALEARVDISNQTVKKAVADLQQARAMVGYQRAGFLPTVTAGVAQSRSRLSQNKLGSSLAGKTTPDYQAGVAASWEPDLFGRVRDAVTGAQANAEASAADLQAVRLSVTAELATDYFALRSLDTQKQLLDETVRAYADALKLLKQQLADGAIDASAVAQAETQLESTQTQDTDIDASRAQLQHALATLVGESASTFTLPPRVQAFDVPAIPAGVPSQLLERRPDIAAAERRVAAANAQIGEARAAFFPDLVLSASAGLESSFFAPWLTAPSLFWSLGSQLAGTLFDGGRRSASLQAAHAQYDGVVADYRQTVLAAFQQVEDQLSALDALASEANSQQRATDAADLSLKLTTNRFNAGAVSYLDVVTAQTIALSNRRLADQIAARRMEAAVALLTALGGGWNKDTDMDAHATAAAHAAATPSVS